VDEYVTTDSPHLMVTEAAIAGSYLSPENHRWVELYLPPGAPSIDLSTLYWVSKDHKGQLAKNGPLTMIPGDIAITHMTEATDTVHIDESDNMGKGVNGWWDVYTHLDPNYWVTTEDLFMISRENSLTPNPLNIFDVVVWSNRDGTAAKTQSILDALNYPIKSSHWGDPIAGSGLFSSTNDSPGVGSINNGYAQRITTIDTDSKEDWRISPINSEGTPPPSPTPLPTPPPPPKPIEVVLSSAHPSEGDGFSVSVIVQPIVDRPFDAYAVITGKAGTFSIQFGNRLRRGVAPIAQNIRSLPQGYSGVLLNRTIPQGVAGDYQVHAGLVDAGSKVRGPGSAFAHDVAALTVR
jgi:hypothetical protein